MIVSDILTPCLKAAKSDKAPSKVTVNLAAKLPTLPLSQQQPLTAAAAKRRIRGQRFSSPIKVLNKIFND